MIQKPLTINQIIEAFPEECRTLIPRVNRALKKQIKPYSKHCDNIRKKAHNKFTEIFLVQVITLYYKPDQILAQIKRNQSIVDVMNMPKDSTKITDAMIEDAKLVPMLTLHDFEKVKSGHARFVACCPFHHEKTGSFTVYANNTYYCFGCHEGGDTIAFVRKLHDLSFPEAVKFLLKQ